MAHGEICWSECVSNDVEAAKAHYGALAGWTFEAMPMSEGSYWIASRDGSPVAGLMAVSDIPLEHVRPHWMTYIEVEDVDAAGRAATDAGGEIVRAPFDIPGVGRISMIAEPGGALAGFIQPEARQGG